MTPQQQTPTPIPARFSEDDAVQLRGILSDVSSWPQLWHHAPLFLRAKIFLNEQFSAVSAAPPTTPEGETYTRAEVLDLMWAALRPFAFQYSPSRGFAAEREAFHREQFAKKLDAFRGARGAGAEP